MSDKTYALLKVRDGLYFVVEDVYGNDNADAGSLEYFYEEHSCPTNWLRNVVAVIEDGDPDPHGFAEVIRSVRRPDTKGSINWLEVFPELKK